MTTERIADHEFEPGYGYCINCGRSRTELVAYGHPDMKLEPGENTGLSCKRGGPTTEAEIDSIRGAWLKDREKWEKLFG